MREALEAFYTFLWPPEEDEARQRLLALLDEDLGGKPIDVLYDLAQELGVRASSLVLDAGCGRGNHSVQLAARFGCRVIALDPLASNLRQVRAHVEKAKAAALVSPVGGTFERIPLDSGAVDFIWCRESLNHARDLGAGCAEMARVLKPSGRLLTYCAVATELLHPGELDATCGLLAVNPSTLSVAALEGAMAQAGLRPLLRASTSAEHSPYREPLTGDAARDVLRLARLRRAPEKYQRAFGPARYDLLVALYVWRAYWTIGKVEQRIWALEKPV
jgi:SAM-dependent methyltransferase